MIYLRQEIGEMMEITYEFWLIIGWVLAGLSAWIYSIVYEFKSLDLIDVLVLPIFLLCGPLAWICIAQIMGINPY